MPPSNPAFLTACEASEAIQAGRLSPVDLVDALLARIDAHDEELHAFAAVYRDEARACAEAAHKAIRAGHAIGPWHGVPIALKDIIDIEGRITTGGSRHWAGARLAFHRDARAPADRSRHDRHRQGQHRGIRHGRLGHQPAHGDAAQSVGPGGPPRAGRLEQRLRRLRRRPARALGDRHRYRRFGADSPRPGADSPASR